MAKTVLIVEDNPMNMRLFTDLLEASGYATLQAVEGGPVLALVRESRPDLILMDIQLPGISGLDLTRLLKSDDELRHIPVIALTAGAFRSDEEAGREAGVDGYLTKPISIPLFLQVVKKHLGNEGGPRIAA